MNHCRSLGTEDVLPLIFDNWGGYYEEGWDFFKRLSSFMTPREPKLAAEAFDGLRDCIAAAIQQSQHSMVHDLNKHPKQSFLPLNAGTDVQMAH